MQAKAQDKNNYMTKGTMPGSEFADAMFKEGGMLEVMTTENKTTKAENAVEETI